MARVTPDQIRQMKARGERIPMLTAYDYAMAQILDTAGLPMLLVGDSLGMVIHGHDSTLPVTLDDIIRHTAAVVRGTQRSRKSNSPFHVRGRSDDFHRRRHGEGDRDFRHARLRVPN